MLASLCDDNCVLHASNLPSPQAYLEHKKGTWIWTTWYALLYHIDNFFHIAFTNQQCGTDKFTMWCTFWLTNTIWNGLSVLRSLLWWQQITKKNVHLVSWSYTFEKTSWCVFICRKVSTLILLFFIINGNCKNEN